MTTTRSDEYLIGLLNELRKYDTEAEWFDFKENNTAPNDMGEYISALSNSAALEGRAFGYLIWGIADDDHTITGTTFTPTTDKIGNEELENWLLQRLSPKLSFRFCEVEVEHKKVIILEIPRASHTPIQFLNEEYIRVGSYKKKLKQIPEKERELWRIFDTTPFEEHLAAENISIDEVLSLLDFPRFFELLEQPLPERASILERLAEEGMLNNSDAGGWNITNLGAILFAKKMGKFKHLSRKAVRVIQYRGSNRMAAAKELVGKKGYASGFEGLIEYIKGLLPNNEVIGKALRKETPMFPDLAIRELIANAIIHQDFSISGTSPMVEIFDDRIEITNPGTSLVDTDRFLNSPPRSRNETLASFMRRIGICEERGSGIDKVVFQTEYYQLPAPLFESMDNATRSILFAHKEFAQMSKADRTRACYLHACLKYANREDMNNSTLRERFNIEAKNSSMVSRIIKDALEVGLIKPFDNSASRKAMKYLPFWA